MIWELKEKTEGGFNRISVRYRGEGCCKLLAVYRDNEGREVPDSFFLEAGEDRAFSGLVTGYLEGKTYGELVSLEAIPLEKEKTDFQLTCAETELCPVFAADTYFLENDRYKVGIRLMWGGGVNYIEDKTCRIPGLGNIINQFDTGRLIQQSYYGTGANGEIGWGEFMGHRWVYNPVQGGDKGGCHSRLIDIRIGTQSVYIKSQPMDWGKVGYVTPSYMENTYSLDGDLIRVDNRFTDYSGWTHPCCHQEVPAFYTVSYLDRFEWYDGAENWQDKPLTVKDDLGFWGLPEYEATTNFRIRESQTEVWSAWVNPQDDWGIGLYVPNIDHLKAGRYSYDGSKDPEAASTNYTAPLVCVKLEAFRPLEYSYLMTTGSTAEIRKIFADNRDFAENNSWGREKRTLRIPDDAPKY